MPEPDEVALTLTVAWTKTGDVVVTVQLKDGARSPVLIGYALQGLGGMLREYGPRVGLPGEVRYLIGLGQASMDPAISEASWGPQDPEGKEKEAEGAGPQEP